MIETAFMAVLIVIGLSADFVCMLFSKHDPNK